MRSNANRQPVRSRVVLAAATMLCFAPAAADAAAVPAVRADAGVAAPADSVFRHRAVVTRVNLGTDRSLSWELVVPARIGAVWRAWTEGDEVATWASPGGYVELRPGGAWEAHFEPDRPPGQRGSDANEIVHFVPERMLILRAGAPQRFPTVRAERTTFVVTLTSVGEGHTLVQASQTGWKEGAEWDEAFAYLARANAVWLDWLHQRFTTGPIDWSKGPAD